VVQGVRFKWKKARTSSFLLPLSGGGNLESRERRGFETHSSHSIRTLFFIFCISELIFVVSCDWARGLGSRRARRRGGGHGGGSGVFRQVFFFVFRGRGSRPSFTFSIFFFSLFSERARPFFSLCPRPVSPPLSSRELRTRDSLSAVEAEPASPPRHSCRRVLFLRRHRRRRRRRRIMPPPALPYKRPFFVIPLPSQDIEVSD